MSEEPAEYNAGTKRKEEDLTLIVRLLPTRDLQIAIARAIYRTEERENGCFKGGCPGWCHDCEHYLPHAKAVIETIRNMKYPQITLDK